MNGNADGCYCASCTGRPDRITVREAAALMARAAKRTRAADMIGAGARLASSADMGAPALDGVVSTLRLTAVLDVATAYTRCACGCDYDRAHDPNSHLSYCPCSGGTAKRWAFRRALKLRAPRRSESGCWYTDGSWHTLRWYLKLVDGFIAVGDSAGW